ncbi:unnamed protein product [Oikopleura dioica]|uniref:Uncharacterized protein n=1 Tax=Oikopleura dioica TaxID=34765 RepID=E4YWW0_OIKDI|nr:unnamed protein product [Oikopleura dioica]
MQFEHMEAHAINQMTNPMVAMSQSSPIPNAQGGLAIAHVMTPSCNQRHTKRVHSGPAETRQPTARWRKSRSNQAANECIYGLVKRPAT